MPSQPTHILKPSWEGAPLGALTSQGRKKIEKALSELYNVAMWA